MSESFVRFHEGTTPLVMTDLHSGLFGLTHRDREILDDPDEFLEFLRGATPEVIQKHVNLDDPCVIRTLRAGVDVAVPALGFDDPGQHSLVKTDLPRFLLDCNRRPADVDRLSVEGAGSPSAAHGLLWRSTGEMVQSRFALIALLLLDRLGIGHVLSGTRDALKGPYTQPEFKEQLLPLYQQCLAAIQCVMAIAKERHQFAILFNGHTFPPYLAAKLKKGPHAGAYVVGPPAQRGPVRGVEDIKAGRMPDAFLIADFDHQTGQPRSCHPAVTQIIREEMEKEGLYVTNGFGPFQGDIGLEAILAKPGEGSHVVAVELVSHNLEPGRVQGSLQVNEKRAAQLRTVYQRIFARLGALTLNDLRTA